MLLKYLPLREDMEENSTVYSCLGKLYEAGHVTLVQSLPRLVNIYAQALTTQEATTGGYPILFLLLFIFVSYTMADPGGGTTGECPL